MRPKLYLVLLAPLLYRHQLRHLPSNMAPVRERDYTTDNPRAWGIPEGLQKSWYLRGTRSSELPNVPHVDRPVSSTGVDLASIWRPTGLRMKFI